MRPESRQETGCADRRNDRQVRSLRPGAIFGVHQGLPGRWECGVLRAVGSALSGLPVLGIVRLTTWASSRKLFERCLIAVNSAMPPAAGMGRRSSGPIHALWTAHAALSRPGSDAGADNASVRLHPDARPFRIWAVNRSWMKCWA